MTVRPKLMMAAGIAVAGLGLIGAGAGATFTAQVAGTMSLSTGNIGLSLNGRTGQHLHLDVDGSNLGSHVAPISKDLLLKNTGTLDMPSTYLNLTAAGCDGSSGAPLVRSLRVTVTDVTHSQQVYDGPLCSAAGDLSPAGYDGRRAHMDDGRRLPYPLHAGESTLYQLVLQPADAEQGLPPAAQNARTIVRVAFTGYDY
ncbi:MAG TPA: hypothetical protein VGK78_15490 [Nocardioides sp.]|uniref:hypothetical protein n=1 Tax=Nocardioides sp. TaxID=35761 RepID=UPI002F4172A7